MGLVLVSMGIGCAVWYAYAPGTEPGRQALTRLFAPFESYEPFLNMEHNEPGFCRYGFVERTDVTPESAFENEVPFAAC